MVEHGYLLHPYVTVHVCDLLILGMDSGSMRLLVNLASPTGLPTTEITFADLAKSAGYNTALVGRIFSLF